MALHALELLPDVAGQELIRREWQALADAGLPSQLDHPGATNAPHLTVVSASHLPDEALDVAKARLGSLLPVRARFAGLVLFGHSRVTIARTVELEDDVVRRVLAVRVQVPHRRPTTWSPHLTLAGGVDRASVQHAVDALQGVADVTVLLTALRRWDPDAGTARVVAGG